MLYFLGGFICASVGLWFESLGAVYCGLVWMISSLMTMTGNRFKELEERVKELEK